MKIKLIFAFIICAFTINAQCTFTACTPFQNSDLNNIYQAVKSTSAGGSSTIAITNSVNVYDNNNDTLNNRLNQIRKYLYYTPTDQTITEIIQGVYNRLYGNTTHVGVSTETTADRLWDAIDAQSITDYAKSINTKLTQTINTAITNTNLATSSNQTLQTTALNGINGNTSKLLGSQLSSGYNVETFEDTELIDLQTQLQNWFFGLGAERVKSVNYSSYAYWNGATEVKKFSAIIIWGN